MASRAFFFVLSSEGLWWQVDFGVTPRYLRRSLIGLLDVKVFLLSLTYRVMLFFNENLSPYRFFVNRSLMAVVKLIQDIKKLQSTKATFRGQDVQDQSIGRRSNQLDISSRPPVPASHPRQQGNIFLTTTKLDKNRTSGQQFSTATKLSFSG